MSDNRTEPTEKQSEPGVCVIMSSILEASSLMRRVAEPYPAGDKVKAAIWRAVQRVSAELRSIGQQPMDFGRGRRIWHREARRIDAFELDAIRRAAAARTRRNEELAGEIRGEVLKAIASFASMRDMLAASDPEMFGPEIDRLGHVIGKLRNRLAPAAGEPASPLIPRSDDGSGR